MSEPRPRLPRTLTALTLMILSLGTAARTDAAVPSIVQQIPAEADAFVAVPSLSGLSEQLFRFNKESGLERPELNGLLGQIKRMGNIRRGLNDDGGAALVLLDAGLPGPDSQDAADRPPQPRGALLLPVSDYDAFLENFGIQNGAEDAPVRIEMQGRRAFVKPTGGYAVISNLSSVVDAFELADGTGVADDAGTFGKQTLEQSDLLIYADMAELRPRLRLMLERELTHIRERLEAMRGRGGEPGGGESNDEGSGSGALQEAIIDLYANGARAFLRDARAAVLGLDLAGKGVAFSGTAQFKADSPLARALEAAPQKPVTFDRLPDRPYMLASSVNLEAMPLDEWFEDAAGKLPENNPLAGVLRSSLRMMGQLEGGAQQAWYLPGGAGGGPGNLFSGVSVYQAQDPEAMRKTYRQTLADLNELKLGPDTGYSTEYETDAMQVAGRRVDQYSLRFELSRQQRRQLGPMLAMLGQGVSGYITTTDDAVIVTNGGDLSLIKDAIKAAENEGGLEKNLGIGESRSGLPGDRVAEMYLDVGSIMRMGRNLIALFAPEKNIEVPNDLPPIAGSVSVREGGVASRLYVPMKVVSALAGAARELQRGGDRDGGGEPGSAEEEELSRNDRDGDHRPRSEALRRFTESEFDLRALEASRRKPVVVALWAPWSEPSEKQFAVLNTLAQRYVSEVRFGTVNVVEEAKLGQRYGVESVPTTVILKNGKVVKRLTGLTSEKKLNEAIEAARSG